MNKDENQPIGDNMIDPEYHKQLERSVEELESRLHELSSFLRAKTAFIKLVVPQAVSKPQILFDEDVSKILDKWTPMIAHIKPIKLQINTAVRLEYLVYCPPCTKPFLFPFIARLVERQETELPKLGGPTVHISCGGEDWDCYLFNPDMLTIDDMDDLGEEEYNELEPSDMFSKIVNSMFAELSSQEALLALIQTTTLSGDTI